MTLKVEGLEEAKRQIWKLAEKKEKQFERGLLRAGLLIQAEAQKITPVDTGHLRGSARTRLIHDRVSMLSKVLRAFQKRVTPHRNVQVEYTASYAVIVHESLHVNFRVGQAKFLETALRNNRARAMGIIIEELRK